MRLCTLMLVMAGVFLPCAAFAAADKPAPSDASLAYLAAFEGKYPFGEPDLYESIFNDPNVKAVVRKSVPGHVMAKILDWTVNSPFKREGSVLYSTLCKPHDCGSYNAAIYFDYGKRIFKVCLSEYDPKRQRNTDSWAGMNVIKLDDGSCDDHGKALQLFKY